MNELQRLTTQYDAAEDRIRLSGSTPGNETLTLWLTQRLLNHLVAHLCGSLERSSAKPMEKAQAPEQALRTHVEQTFAQQRALAALSQQRPVDPMQVSPSWRVDTVAVKRTGNGVRLTFSGVKEGERAQLDMPTPVLRQWLSILYKHYRRAGWPILVWPAWMEEAKHALPVPGKTLIH